MGHYTQDSAPGPGESLPFSDVLPLYGRNGAPVLIGQDLLGGFGTQRARIRATRRPGLSCARTRVRQHR